MSVFAGIDCGGSCTKISLLRTGEATQHFKLPFQADPRAVLPGQGQYVAITGVRANETNWSGFDAQRLTEYEATALGARALSGLEEALVVNCGTGTTFLHAAPGRTEHLGGSGIGGGMLPGLGLRLLGTGDIAEISRLASRGDLSGVDLTISDFSNTSQLSLGADVTVSNFGKLTADTAPEDTALALLNALFQTVGIMAALAARSCGTADIVVTGGTAGIPQAKHLLDKVGELCRVRFHLPEKGVFATSYGAALLQKQQHPGGIFL